MRLGLTEPKAFVRLAGATLFGHVLRTLASVEGVQEAVIAIPAGTEATTRTEIAAVGFDLPVKITPGGTERQDSVRIALALTSADAKLIVVHDAARPFATAPMFEACLEAAQQGGAAIVAIPVADSLKRVDRRTITGTIQRSSLWHAQTPQAFRREILRKAHMQALRAGVTATDDAELVERIGGAVVVVEGSRFNFKITTRDDLRMAEAIVREGVLH
jgi:2-C-methyl-D-erythritol 4-phosphate cytidylyltransferase